MLRHARVFFYFYFYSDPSSKSNVHRDFGGDECFHMHCQVTENVMNRWNFAQVKNELRRRPRGSLPRVCLNEILSNEEAQTCVHDPE